MSNRPGAFFRVPGQKVTTPGDYDALPSQPDVLARPMPFAPGNDIDFQVTSITEGYKRILSRVIPYYKISTTNSQVNIYGESMAKNLFVPTSPERRMREEKRFCVKQRILLLVLVLQICLPASVTTI
jgi:hypothetical protein